jgi:hypothetical protein
MPRPLPKLILFATAVSLPLAKQGAHQGRRSSEE